MRIYFETRQKGDSPTNTTLFNEYFCHYIPEGHSFGGFSTKMNTAIAEKGDLIFFYSHDRETLIVGSYVATHNGKILSDTVARVDLPPLDEVVPKSKRESHRLYMQERFLKAVRMGRVPLYLPGGPVPLHVHLQRKAIEASPITN